MKFKVGDKVKLVKLDEGWSHASTNPLWGGKCGNVQGEVDQTENNERWIGVMWSNGKHNTYRAHNLEHIDEKPSAAGGGIMKIQEGWVFHSADFSIQACNGEGSGVVKLIRNPYERGRWHDMRQQKEDENCPPLSVYGTGLTLEDAITVANQAAATATPIPASPPDLMVRCQRCGNDVPAYYHDAGDHFGAGLSPGSEWRARKHNCVVGKSVTPEKDDNAVNLAILRIISEFMSRVESWGMDGLVGANVHSSKGSSYIHLTPKLFKSLFNKWEMEMGASSVQLSTTLPDGRQVIALSDDIDDFIKLKEKESSHE